MKRFLLSLLLAGPLSAADPSLPDEINVAGASIKTGGCCLAWNPDTAAQITGQYEGINITDGSSALELTATGEGRDIILSGRIETKWADFSTSTSTFSRAELSGQEDPCLIAARGVIRGWLVPFNHPDKKENALRPAIIPGGDVYVRVEWSFYSAAGPEAAGMRTAGSRRMAATFRASPAR